jgi:hypothetical protein
MWFSLVPRLSVFCGNYGYLWYQGYHFSMVIMVISGMKVISFYGNYCYLWYQGYQLSKVIMVVSGTKVLNIPEVTAFIYSTNVTSIPMITMSHIYKSVLSQDFLLLGSFIQPCASSILRNARKLCMNVIQFEVDKVRLSGGSFGTTGGD